MSIASNGDWMIFMEEVVSVHAYPHAGRRFLIPIKPGFGITVQVSGAMPTPAWACSYLDGQGKNKIM
ncbi:MAG: hypothetical protein JXA82_00465 [Sedimentisphaerales bacterium]|nr:hypothetical protein [Sedimentisphaerales bacterium]